MKLSFDRMHPLSPLRKKYKVAGSNLVMGRISLAADSPPTLPNAKPYIVKPMVRRKICFGAPKPGINVGDILYVPVTPDKSYESAKLPTEV